MSNPHKQDFPVAGFISPPGWYDPSPVEFTAHCDGPVGTQQCLLPLQGFDFALSSIAQVEPEMMTAARTLGAASCDAVAMTGTPFGWAGLTREAEARTRCQRLSDAAGAPAIMTGLAIVDGLRALGAQKVALAPTYHADDWRDAWRAFVEACGLTVTLCETLTDQLLIPDGENPDHLGWAINQDLITASVTAIAQNPRGAEAIVVTGAGCRTNLFVTELEAKTGLPVLGADTASFWSVAQVAGISLKPGALGAITDL